MGDIRLSGSIKSATVLSGTLSIKAHLSTHHIAAAAFYARRLQQIEAESPHGKALQGDLWREYRSYAMSAVVMAAASLEAGINEVFLDAVENTERVWAKHPPTTPRLLAAMWDQVERHPILAKFEYALVAAAKEPMDRGRAPYQNVAMVVKLRDALLHFKPEWSSDQREHQKIADRLRTKFPESPFWAAGNPFFPDKCLGAGCAKWATEACVAFMDEFCHRIEIPSRFDHIRAGLGVPPT